MKYLFIATSLLSIVTVNSLPADTVATNTNTVAPAANGDSKSVEAKGFDPYGGYGGYPYGGYPYGGYPNGYYNYYQQPYQYQRNPSILGSIFGQNGLVNSILGTNGGVGGIL
ncbi:hypothetical protein K502DRAFT_359710 [Neoconidiobolus thromboides FSU 785]|nr:hypothetical protein K502DRAFT_359710 [Neoconidiobolus thromboides FSU 785]